MRRRQDIAGSDFRSPRSTPGRSRWQFQRSYHAVSRVLTVVTFTGRFRAGRLFRNNRTRMEPTIPSSCTALSGGPRTDPGPNCKRLSSMSFRPSPAAGFGRSTAGSKSIFDQARVCGDRSEIQNNLSTASSQCGHADTAPADRCQSGAAGAVSRGAGRQFLVTTDIRGNPGGASDAIQQDSSVSVRHP